MNNILLTGSSSGIGKEITLRLLNAGNKVVGMARHHAKFQPQHETYIPYTIDFSKINLLEMALKELASLYPELDTLILSAGYGKFATLEQWSLHDMQTMMNVNFLSQVMVVKAFLPNMKKNKKGRIIVIGSECALRGDKQASIYSASKFALRGFCQSIRRECAASNIAVTLINPGLTRTPFFDDLSFYPGNEEIHAITPQQIADCVMQCLSLDKNCVVEEINLQPLVGKVERKDR